MKWHSNPEKLVIHNKFVVKRLYFSNRQLAIEEYSINGLKHNPLNGAAYTLYNEDGVIWWRSYYTNGVRHGWNH